MQNDMNCQKFPLYAQQIPNKNTCHDLSQIVLITRKNIYVCMYADWQTFIVMK